MDENMLNSFMNKLTHVPGKYRLIRTSTGYRWENVTQLSKYETIDFANVYIETWKGVYLVTHIIPKKVTRYTNVFFKPDMDEFPLWLYGRSISGHSKTTTMTVWSVIDHKWLTFSSISHQRCVQKASIKMNKSIIAWIEAQPPQPDYKQAKKDRVDVEQTFSEM